MKKCGIALACVSLLSPAYGVKLVGDDFSYAAASAITSADGGFGWTGAWSTPTTTNTATSVVAPGTAFSYSSGTLGIPASNFNGAFQLGSTATASNTSVLARNFTSTSATDVYVSFMVRYTVGTMSTSDSMYLYFGTAGTSTARYDLGIVGNTTNDFAVRTSDNAGYTASGGNITASATTTYFVVGKLSKAGSTDYNSFTLWANPSSPIESQNTGVTSSTAAGSDDLASLSSLGFGFANLDNTETFQIDNLQIGTTWQDVITPVPFGVDSTLGLALLGGAAALRLRRKKTKSS